MSSRIPLFPFPLPKKRIFLLACFFIACLAPAFAGQDCAVGGCGHEHGKGELSRPAEIDITACAASPEPFEVEQPDGGKAWLHIRGNEFFHWQEDLEGFVVKKDTDGAWKYAKPKANSADFDVVPGAKVGVVDPGALGLKKRDLPGKEVVKAHVKKIEASVRDSLPKEEVGGGKSLQQKLAEAGVFAAPDAGSAQAPAEGTGEEGLPSTPPDSGEQPISVAGTVTVKNIVILASFNDHWDAANGTVLATKGKTQAEFDALFNQVGYNVDGAVGSVKDFYLENSYGKVTVDSIVSVWVHLPQDEVYYGANGTTKDTNWKAMLSDAVNALDTAGFDFSQGDGDGDGWVDCFTVIHSGYGEEASGSVVDQIWSKKGNMTSVLTKDGVKLYKAHTEPALRGSSGTGITRIGVICHELGHFFGLPDLYDYGATYEPVNKWCVMASGSWNGTSGTRPSHFSAWSKMILGFVKPEIVHSKNGHSLRAVETYPDVHMIRDGCSNGEYFLLENRNGTGFDANTPGATPGKGILIWHVDSDEKNNDSLTCAHPVLKLEDADGDFILTETADPWFSGNAMMISGGFRDQTAKPNTNAMRYQAAHYYQRTDTAADYTYVRISGFSAQGATMTYNLTTLIPTVAGQSVLVPDYSVAWSASTDAVKYEIQEGTVSTATTFSEGFEDEDAMYDAWILSGALRKSDSAQAGTYSVLFSEYHDSKYWNSSQFAEMRNGFLLNANTAVSFYYKCGLGAGNGNMKLQATNDNGVTWKTLWTHNGGSVSSWTLITVNAAMITGVGYSVGETLKLRFVTDSQYTNGWSTYPPYGWAVDSVTVSNTAVPDYTGWTTLNNNVTDAFYAVTGKATGNYAYRVRASRDGTNFGNWSPPAVVAVTISNQPEMAVSGNGVAIVDGDASPAVADGTDFGTAAVVGGSATRTFTVSNVGSMALNLTGATKVVLGGANASDFTVSAQPTSPVAPVSGTTTFSVVFDPSAGGARTATVSVANDDSDENPYNFSIQGTGDAPSLTYSAAVFSESGANDGSIINTVPVTITLAGDTFTGNSGDDFVAGGKVAVTNLPSGLTAVATRGSDTQLSVVLTGNASAHANANDVSNLSFAFQNSAFSGGQAGVVTGASKGDLAVNFNDAATPFLTYSNSATFTESSNGAIGNTVVITLSNDTFAADVVSAGRIAVTNLPQGLTASFVRNSNTQITFSLVGNATYHAPQNSMGYLGVDFGTGSFSNTQPAGVTESSRNCSVTFSGVATTTIQVANANDSGAGSLRDIITTKALAGDTIVIPSGTANLTLTSGQIAIAKNMTIAGPGADVFAISGNNASRIFYINGAYTVTIRDMTISDGLCEAAAVDANGGAIYNSGTLVLERVVLEGNTARAVDIDGTTDNGQGGAIYSATGGLTMTDVVVSNNTATTLRGLAGYGLGGGVYVSSGTFSALRCAFFGNIATGTDGVGADGGALYIATTSEATIRNSTIYDNAADDMGGAIYYTGAGTKTIYNSTITSNASGTSDGAVNLANNSVVSFDSTIISGNAASTYEIESANTTNASALTNCFYDSAKIPNFGVRVTATGGVDSSDPKFEAIADNGGFSPTCALLPTSRAVNAGSDPLTLVTDGRGTGFARVQSGAADIGAFESPYAPAPEMVVTRNAVEVANGATDLVNNSAAFLVHPISYQIKNEGSVALAMAFGASVSSTVNCAASVTAQPSSPLALAGGTTALTLSVTPSSAGAWSFVVSIPNDDPDESPYGWTVSGEAVAYPDISVKGNGQSIASGDVTPASSDHTDFGGTPAGGGSISRIFSVENVGYSTLHLTGASAVVLSGEHAEDFAVSVQPTTSLAASASSSFQISFTPSAMGTRNATVTISSDDPDTESFSFAVRGTGEDPLLWTVSSSADSGPGSLRDAVANASAGRTIQFDPSVTSIALTSGEIPITKTVTIDGGGAVTVSGGGLSRVFYVHHASDAIEVTISDLVIADGNAVAAAGSHAYGGGIYNKGETLTLNRVAIVDCAVSGTCSQVSATSYSGFGGGIASDGGAVVLVDCSVDGNTATGTPTVGTGASAGAITMNGTSVQSIAVAAGGTGYSVAPPVIISGGTKTVVATATATISGGAVTGFTITNPGNYTIAPTGVTIGATGVGYGGGVYVSGGSLVIDGCTISMNTATGGTAATADGGGLYLATTGVSTMVNSTVSGNTAADQGGAIYLDNGTLNLYNSTVTANTSDAAEGAIEITADGKLNAISSILCGNTGSPYDIENANTTKAQLVLEDCLYNSAKLDAVAEYTITNGVSTTDAKLDVLADNGGSTWTHALQAGSPAIGAGSTAAAVTAGFTMTTDQRGTGFARSIGASVDIGAFEYSETPTPEIAVTRSGAVADGGTDSVSGTTATQGTQLTYTIANSGTADLTLSNAVEAGETNCSVAIDTQASSPIAASGSSDLVVTVTPAAAGAWSFTLSVANNDSDENPYNWTVSGTAAANLTVQTISFGALAGKVFGDVAFDLTATASSGLAVSYSSSNTGVATVSGSTVTVVGAGTTTITASQAGNGVYAAATPVQQTLAVSKATQTISFGALAGKTVGAAPFALTATASSGLAVSYSSSNTGVATVSGSTVTIVGAGTTTITASQAGNDNYEAATNVGQSLTVGEASVAEIDVSGNGVSIASGDTIPSAGDHTDFGSAAVSGGSVTRVFTVANTGSGTLSLTGTPKVALSGANASDFSVSVQPASSVAGGESTTFSVVFDPAAGGVKVATVTIASDDADEAGYSFAVRGTATHPGFTVAAWNVFSNLDQAVTRNSVVAMRPDVMLLMESGAEAEVDLLKTDLEAATGATYYKYYPNPQKSTQYPLAFLSKFPISASEDLTLVNATPTWLTSVLKSAPRIKISVDGEDYDIVGIHARIADSSAHETEINNLFAKLQTVTNHQRTIVIGDFNSRSRLDGAVTDPYTDANYATAGFTFPNVYSTSKFLDAGYRDAWRHIYPSAAVQVTKLYKTDGAAGSNYNERIDHCFISSDLTLHDAGIVETTSNVDSDHRPVWVRVATVAATTTTSGGTQQQTAGPRIVSSAMAADNSYVDVVFNEGVYANANATGALTDAHFELTFEKHSGGLATGCSVASVTHTAGSATARVNLTLTGTPNGYETIKLHLAGNNDSPAVKKTPVHIYNAAGTADAWTRYLSGAPYASAQRTNYHAFNATMNWTVTSSADSGEGSLRQVLAACANGATVSFDPSVTSITLASEIAVAKNVTVDGGGTVTVSGGDVTRIFNCNGAGTTVVLKGLVLTNGKATATTDDADGGAILNNGSNLVVEGCVVQNSTAEVTAANAMADNGQGGGISQLAGSLTIKESTIKGNTANTSAGTVTLQAYGGGVYVAAGNLTVQSSTISGNAAIGATAVVSDGGGLYVNTTGAVSVVNSTISGNSAHDQGGAIYFGAAGVYKIYNSTITANTSEGGEGAIFLGTTATLSLHSTIVTGNLVASGTLYDIESSNSTTLPSVTLADCFYDSAKIASFGTRVTASGGLLGANPLLGTLASNGGPTQTHALQAGSTAIGAGSAAAAEAAGFTMTTDQRGTGYARSSGVGVDIGAYEVQVVAVPEMGVSRGAAVADGGTDAVAGSTVAGAGTQLTYTIANSGTAALSLTTPVTASSSNNCSVVIDTQPSDSVAASAQTTLVLTVTPSALGNWSFAVSIANNDSDEAPYNWSVSGTADKETLSAWAASYSLSGSDALWDAAPGGDGVPNLLKHAMALEPLSPSAGMLPSVSVENGNLVLSFRKSKTASAMAYMVQSSADLSGVWADETAATAATLAAAPAASDADADVYRVSIPLSGSKLFLRLKVTK